MSTQAEAHAEAEITQTGGSPRPDGVYGAFTSVGDGVRRATADLLRGARNWELWTSLGWHEIRQRYRRSIIGPFWLTLSMGAIRPGRNLAEQRHTHDIERMRERIEIDEGRSVSHGGLGDARRADCRVSILRTLSCAYRVLALRTPPWPE
jgi:hypothetical protein